MNKETDNNDVKQLSIVYLQRLWNRKFKLLTTHHIIEHLFSLGLTNEHVQSINFESLVVFLKKKSILLASKKCLLRIYQLCFNRHGSSNIFNMSENKNVRIFLASFMITYYPTHVFESMGTLEKPLFESSEKMLKTFQNICNIIHTSPNHCFHDVPHELSEKFLTMFFEYINCFKTWKTPDEAIIVQRIKNALIALYNAKDHLSHNNSNYSNLQIELDTQINRLRTKLRQIAGLEKLAQFDEEHKPLDTIMQFDTQLNSEINRN